jgi:hypothetical protein
MRGVLRVVEEHLESGHVSRVVYGSIIGLALVVALEKHPPAAGVVAATLVITGIAVALAELYSEVLGHETRTRTRVDRIRLAELGEHSGAVFVGISFPAVFFGLAAADAIELDTAFDVAKWSGLGLTGFYGFWAARLSGRSLHGALGYALAIAAVGALLIGLKALVH